MKSVCVGPEEPFDALHLENNRHNCPQWLRLSLWTSCSDANSILNGTSETSVNLITRDRSGFLSNKELSSLSGLSLAFVCEFTKIYDLNCKSFDEFRSALANHGFPFNCISAVEALSGLGKKFLPEPCFVLGKFKFYSLDDLDKAKLSVPLRYGKQKEDLTKQSTCATIENTN